MSLTGHRTERILIEHLTKEDNSLGYLDGMEGGSLHWNANADLPAGGTILLEDLNQGINFSKDRIRVWWEVDGETPWALGVYVIAAPGITFRGDGKSRTLNLIDKLTIVKDDIITETLQLPAGTNAIEAARDQILAAGELRIARTPSSVVLTAPLTWYPGTSRLRIINDLATVAGYWSLWTDRTGQFRLEPYVSPANRPIAYSFIEGEVSIHSPNWQYELSLWEATNKVVMVSQADDNDNVFYSSAVDDNPDSPTSTVSMGRVLNPIVEENVEAESQVALDAMATRKLLDNSNVVGKVSISHAVMPVWYNEAVLFRSQGMDTLATITEMNIPLVPGSLAQDVWRQAL